MAQSSNESLWGAWPGGILIVILVALGILVPSPYQRTRPSEDVSGLRPEPREADARLWQDPFAAARLEAKERTAGDKERRRQWAEQATACALINLTLNKTPGGAHPDCAMPANLPGPERPLEQLQRAIGTEAERGKVWVLGVLVAGNQTMGAGETRRRIRYATLSGLMQEGLTPRDPEHIGYVHAPDRTDGECGPCLPRILPFEWFDQEDQPGNGVRVLVLWLDEDELEAHCPKEPGLSKRPLGKLAHWLAALDPWSPVVDFALIGPTTSTTLERMTREGQQHCCKLDDAIIRMWSPVATIPLSEEVESAQLCGSSGTGNPPLCVRAPTGLLRTIATDDRVAGLLARELIYRGVDANHRIALVGQWDTAYSRSLARLVTKEWCHRAGGGADCGTTLVRQYRYMRGIDGVIPSASAKEDGKPGAKAGGKDDPPAAGDIERAYGDAQVDYLRRLRDTMLAEDSSMRRGCKFSGRLAHRCGIRAIGILGDDYHDKLMVLQALRPAFPEAVFFTTDLNADMLHPKHNPFTRNLVVASGYGLTMAPDLQGQVPPLRDSYQTSMLRAVRLALGVLGGKSKEQDGEAPLPRLFEIGRTEAVALALPPEDRDQKGGQKAQDSQEAFQPKKASPQDIHPRDEDRYFSPGILGTYFLQALLIMGLGAALVASTRPKYRIWFKRRWDRVRAWLSPKWHKVCARLPPTWKQTCIRLAQVCDQGDHQTADAGPKPQEDHTRVTQDQRPPSRRWWRLVAAWAILGLALVGGLLWDLGHAGEPFSLVQGVSAWPSEVLRFVAGVLAVWFLVRGHDKQTDACNRAAEDTFPHLGPPCTEGDSVKRYDRREGTGPKETQQVPQADAKRETAETSAETSNCRVYLQRDGCPETGKQAEDDDFCKGSQPYKAEDIWRDYRTRMGVGQTLKRIWPAMLLYLLLAWTLMVILGFPNRPVRGDLALGLDFWFTMFVVFPFLALLFYVVDATREALRVAHCLSKPVSWPEETLKVIGLGGWVKRDELSGEMRGDDVVWLDVKLIGTITEPVGNLVWYPFLFLILIAAARVTLFDAWALSPALILVLAIALAYIAGTALTLRKAAEEVRTDAQQQLKRALAKAEDSPDGAQCAKRLKDLLERVQGAQLGAFRPFSQQPLVHATLTLVSGISGFAVIEYLSYLNL